MVAYSFDKRFAAPIIEGTKRQTIRGERKRHARRGEVMQLYTGMRTKYCRSIGTAICQSASPITIDFAEPGRVTYQFGPGVTTVWPLGLDDFARGDGFADWAEMRAFWAKHHPGLETYTGVMVKWTEFRPAGEMPH